MEQYSTRNTINERCNEYEAQELAAGQEERIFFRLKSWYLPRSLPSVPSTFITSKGIVLRATYPGACRRKTRQRDARYEMRGKRSYLLWFFDGHVLSMMSKVEPERWFNSVSVKDSTSVLWQVMKTWMRQCRGTFQAR